MVLCGTLVLAGCGGGGSSTGSAFTPETLVARSSPPAQAATAPAALVPQPVSLVNTTTAGNQAGRAIGGTADGGYTVVWDGSLSMRHYDSSGHAAGPQTALQFVAGTGGSSSSQVTSTSVAVLEDASVVVAYAMTRTFAPERAPTVTTAGLYLQRFGPDGAQIVPETQVYVLEIGDPRRPSTVQDVQALAMPGGGYVLGWTLSSVSATVGWLNAFTTQFFDARNQPVGASIGLGGISMSASIVADGLGGYTLYWSGLRPDFQPTGLNVEHYDATQTKLSVLSAWPGSALLLPLDDGRYLLYTSSVATGRSRQLLDSSGAAQGPAMPVADMRVLAGLLADGSYVAAWPTDAGGLGAQRFDVQGTPMGGVLALPADATKRHLITPLSDGGFAVAWTAAGASGDLDVYTQTFVEAPDRKSCLRGARGLRGQARKAFIANCLPGKGLH
jgi:hypothetical protein